jgi:hypothetical protein
VRFLDYPKAPDQGLFLLAGQLDQRFRLARSTDAGDWPVGDLLEIADPGGVLILLDYATNDPVRQFFRTTGP